MFYEEMIGQHKFLDIKYFHEHSNISLVDIPSNIIDIHYIISGQNFIGCSSISDHKVGNNTFQSCSL